MEMQEWDQPQKFDSQTNSNSNDWRILNQNNNNKPIKHNTLYYNSQKQFKHNKINPQHNNYYHNRNNNHYVYKQKHYQKKNNKYKNNTNNINNQTQSTLEVLELKSNNITIPKQNINIEINNSNAPILYCPPKANNSTHIITIKPYAPIPSKPKDSIRIIAIGCTHELHNQIFFPNGDLLIHAGDICNHKRHYHLPRYQTTFWKNKTAYDIWNDFVSLLNKKRNNNNFQYGIYIIPGNHDTYCKQNINKIKLLLKQNNIKLLINQSDIINICNYKLKIFGSPISFYRGKPKSNAWQVHREAFKYLWNKDIRLESEKYWDYYLISKQFECANILVTHGPAYGFGDNENGVGTGSFALLQYIKKQKPKLFICADFHGYGRGSYGYGIRFLRFGGNECCIMCNVAMAHTNAFKLNNLQRGVTIIDVKQEDLN